MPGLWALPVYKVSYVAASSEHPGAIINRDHAPIIGERITLGEDLFEVVEVLDLMPPVTNSSISTLQFGLLIEERNIKINW